MTDVIGRSIITTEVDSSNLKTGIAESKAAVKDFENAAVGSANKVGQAMTDSANKTAGANEKLDATTRRLIGSIERESMAAGRSRSEYLELRAAKLGVSDTVAPYIARLREQEAATKAAEIAARAEAAAVRAAAEAKRSAGIVFNQYGLSTKQTTAALRQVPAQLTDIIVSLQGGQAPLTVLLQQGGQLRDVFGGIVPAARALGGSLLGLINPYTLLAAAVAAAVAGYAIGSREVDEYNKALITTGNAAGTTAGQLQQQARSIAAIVGTQAAAAEALAALAGTGRVAASDLEQFAMVAVKAQRTLGIEVAETAKQFADLGKDPVDASRKLNESTNFLTLAIYEQIKSLKEQGRETEAAALAQKTFADVLDSRTNQITNNLGFIERGWLAVKDAVKSAGDAILAIGRQATPEGQLAVLQKTLADREARPPVNPLLTENYEKGNAKLKEQIALLQSDTRQTKLLANAEAERTRVQKEGVAASDAAGKTAEQYATKTEKLNSALEKYRRNLTAIRAANPNSAELDPARIARTEAGIRTGILGSNKSGAAAARRLDKAELDEELNAIRKSNAELINTYKNSESILESLRASGIVGDKEYYEAKRGFINLETAAKEDALQKEIARLQQEKLTGADAVKNRQKIADAEAKLTMMRADSTAKLVVLGNQEAAAAMRIASSYIAARQAAEDYLSTFNQQQDRSIADIGRGDRSRSFSAGVSQIEDRFGNQRQNLENQRRIAEANNTFGPEARAKYDAELALILEFQEKSVKAFEDGFKRRSEAEANWVNGATRALENYYDQSANVASQVDDLFTKGFKGLEDALVEFTKTGKLSFKSLADSIIADINRMIIKQQITGPLAQFLGLQTGASGGGGLGGGTGGNLITAGLNALFGRDSGGMVSRGGMYEVNENRPELLNVNGKQFLMMGNQSGSVDSNRGRSGGTTVINTTINVPQTTSRITGAQLGADYGRKLAQSSRVS